MVDHFHAIRLANRAIDECRRRIQNQTLGHRGHKSDPLYRARRALLTGYERLTSERLEWMQSLLAVGDQTGMSTPASSPRSSSETCLPPPARLTPGAA